MRARQPGPRGPVAPAPRPAWPSRSGRLPHAARRPALDLLRRARQSPAGANGRGGRRDFDRPIPLQSAGAALGRVGGPARLVHRDGHRAPAHRAGEPPRLPSVHVTGDAVLGQAPDLQEPPQPPAAAPDPAGVRQRQAATDQQPLHGPGGGDVQQAVALRRILVAVPELAHPVRRRHPLLVVLEG